jgi:hypothetical protein
VKVLCLVDGRVESPDKWIWNYLPACAQSDTVDFMHVRSRDLFPKWGKLFTYYPAYWNLAVRALRQSRKVDYDLIVAWEGKNGFPLALISSVLRIRMPKMVILTYIQRGVVTHFPTTTRFALSSVDHLTVTSRWEAEHYSKTLEIPEEKITFCPLGWYDYGTACSESQVAQEETFIFASGRSYRDYATFAAALEGIESGVVVNARKFNLKGISFPTHVVINDLLPREEFWKLLTQAYFVVVPLMEVQHSAGDGHIVQAMAAGKAVIATHGPSTQTYVEDGVTGFLVPPHDVARLREAMEYLLSHPEEVKAMGQRARQRYEEEYTFTAFAERTYKVLQKVANAGTV